MHRAIGGQEAPFRDVVELPQSRRSIPVASSGRLGGVSIDMTTRITARRLRCGATRTLIQWGE
jgi:hypothetical protein